MGIGINRGLRSQDLVAFLGDQDNFPLHFSTRIMRRLIFCWQCRQSRAQVETAAETQRERHGKRPRWRLFLVLVLVLVRARQWPRAALTTRASGHIKLKFQLEIAQLLLPVHPWPNCSHAPQQIASAWAWAWVWAADEARTAVARWKWMLRCPWCDAMRCAAMSIGSTWDGTWAKISLLTPSIWCAGATLPKRQCAPIPIVMPVPARGLQMRCLMPGATIRADYACPVWHFVDFCADILWILSVLWQELFIIPFP